MAEEKSNAESTVSWAKAARAAVDSKPNPLRDIARQVWSESKPLQEARARTMANQPVAIGTKPQR